MKSVKFGVWYFAIIAIFTFQLSGCGKNNSNPLNVIVIMTDDQGYGDIAAHGNPYVETPNMDRLHNKSIRLENFHVAPTCSPTRAQLMTGKHNHRVGVWHTVLGLERLRRTELTMADVFAESGYATGIFGKWHLGDGYPFRPGDRGFQESVICQGGSVTQMPNYWDNDRMNDTYFHNDQPKKYRGYSADVFFEEAMSFINKNKDKPFFAYLPTSAPHGPLNVLQEWADKYENKGLNEQQAAFYASIERVDYNLGKLMKFLHESGLEQNTMLVFLTDNGTAHPNNHNSAGMKGAKGSVYEGGHRVPCFIYSPKNNLVGGKQYYEPTSVMDLLPTFIDVCGLKMGEPTKFDGQSLMPLLSGKETRLNQRYLMVETQRVPHPIKWKRFAVIHDHWRLVNGKELYNIEKDPGQKQDKAALYPDVVQDLRKNYEIIWDDISTNDDQYQRFILGSPKSHETLLTAIDWYWRNNNDKQDLIVGQSVVREGKLGNGNWPVYVEQAGEYVFELRRWPRESGLPINGTTPEITSENNDIALKKYGEKPQGKVLDVMRAMLRVNGEEKEVAVDSSKESVKFTMPLTKGETDVQTWFYTREGDSLGAYYVYVKKK
ncbi:MAG: arylsulfatase [Bacteroidota bacterium]